MTIQILANGMSPYININHVGGTSSNLRYDVSGTSINAGNYSVTVTGILNANCNNCHGASANNLGGGIVLNTYATVKPYITNGRLVNSILQNGQASPMPKNMAKMDVCSINKIIVWVNRGAINN